jgi:DNA-binding MarR family transcriptional regulator
MSQPEPPPPEVPSWDTLGRQLGAYTVAFANAVAERVGINRTDYECLDLLDAHGGALTAGQLAELTGLTSGAVTGVIDRLERARLVKRASDPTDRRRVIVEMTHARAAEFDEIFGSYARGWEELASRYSPEQLDLILSYVAGAVELLQEQTLRVRSLPARPKRGQPRRRAG